MFLGFFECMGSFLAFLIPEISCISFRLSVFLGLFRIFGILSIFLGFCVSFLGFFGFFGLFLDLLERCTGFFE